MEMRSARGTTTYVHLRSLRRALQYNPCKLAMSNSAFGQIGGNMSTRSGFTASWRARGIPWDARESAGLWCCNIDDRHDNALSSTVGWDLLQVLM